MKEYLKIIATSTMACIACGIFILFLSLCLYNDKDGLGWLESRSKIEHPTWKGGYVLCRDKTVIYRGYELDEEYFELVELARKECEDE